MINPTSVLKTVREQNRNDLFYMHQPSNKTIFTGYNVNSRRSRHFSSPSVSEQPGLSSALSVSSSSSTIHQNQSPIFSRPHELENRPGLKRNINYEKANQSIQFKKDMDRIYYVNNQGVLDYIPDNTRHDAVAAKHQSQSLNVNVREKSHCFTAYSSMANGQSNEDHKSCNYNQTSGANLGINYSYGQQLVDSMNRSGSVKSSDSGTGN